MRIKVINQHNSRSSNNHPYAKMNDVLTHIRKYIVNGSYGIMIQQI